MSGADFLGELENNTPSLATYVPNAGSYKKYDFKNTNGTDKQIEGIDPYRGMPIGEENGVPLITSARDIGNIGAGYMAGVNGISFSNAETAFDAYETLSNMSVLNKVYLAIDSFKLMRGNIYGIFGISINMVSNWKREGVSTKNAEKYGWKKGNAVYRQNKRK